jgi:ubiquinone/menaquinone biosynthesis C-methylase UbiE
MELKDTTPQMDFVDPEEIIAMAGVGEGEIVADFGCGPGYFSLPLAKIVGKEGKVFSFDILSSALEALKSQVKLQGIGNVIIKRVNLEKIRGTELEDGSIDWVIIKDILFQNKAKSIILEEAYRILKPAGKILVMEWQKDGPNIGPDNELRLSPLELKKLISDVNFTTEKTLDAGSYHYALIATK